MHTLSRSANGCRSLLKVATFSAAVVFWILVLIAVAAAAGCSNTMARQYTVAAGTYNTITRAAALGHDVAVLAGRSNPQLWEKIQADEALARQHLVEAYDYLKANPSLANVPGLALPPLDPFNIVLATLGSDLAGLQLVPANPPAVPTTAPGG